MLGKTENRAGPQSLHWEYTNPARGMEGERPDHSKNPTVGNADPQSRSETGGLVGWQHKTLQCGMEGKDLRNFRKWPQPRPAISERDGESGMTARTLQRGMEGKRPTELKRCPQTQARRPISVRALWSGAADRAYAEWKAKPPTELAEDGNKPDPQSRGSRTPDCGFRAWARGGALRLSLSEL